MNIMSDNSKKIDSEKAQSVIVDYMDLRGHMEWTVSIGVGLGSFLIVLSFFLFESIQSVMNTNSTVVLVIVLVIPMVGMWLIIDCGMILVKLLHKRKSNRERIRAVHSELIRRSYFVNFEIVGTEEKMQLEKLFNHLSLVFPEIKKIQKKLKKKDTAIEDFQKRQKFAKKISFLSNYDLVLKTTMGFFVIKIFDKVVTFEDIEDSIKHLNRRQIDFRFFGPTGIERVIMLSKSYERLFNTPELANKMNSLKRRYRLDLIVEEDEYGYGTIWID